MLEWREIEKCSNGVRYRKFIDGKPTNGYKLIIGADPSIDEQVGASADDCLYYENAGSPVFSTTSSFQTAGGSGVGLRKNGGGMRFQTVAIPQGATIGEAYLTLRCGYATSGTVCRTRIRGEDVDDAAAFSTRTNYLGRTRITAYVDWDNIPAWTVDTNYNSPDIKTVIQEIIDREGWASGNDMVIFWDDHDDRSDENAYCERYARSYNGSPTYAPKIHIEYTVGEAIQKAVNGTLSFAGSLSSTLMRIVAAGGSLALAGAISRFTSKNTQGSLSFAGIITRRTFKSLAGALSSAGALAKMTQKILSGQLFAGRYEYYYDGESIESVYGATWRAQTFTPLVSHTIAKVRLPLERQGLPGTFTISIRATDGDGKPTGGDLCSASINGNILPGIPEWQTINFGTGYPLIANTQYAIVTRAPSGSIHIWVGWAADVTSPAYTRGSRANSTDSGLSWTLMTTWDFKFEEWGILAYGTLGKLSQKIMAGTISPAGELVRNIYKIVAGAISPSGILTAARIIPQAVGGVLEFVGSLGAELITTTQVAVGGVLSFVGDLSIFLGWAVSLGGELTLAGTLIKNTGKNLLGSLTPSGALGKVILVAISGTLTTAGLLVKNTSKNVVGLLTSYGMVTKFTRKLMRGTLTFTGSVKKTVSKIVRGVLSFVGVLPKPGRDLVMRLSHRPYRDMTTGAKPHRDMSVESRDD